MVHKYFLNKKGNFLIACENHILSGKIIVFIRENASLDVHKVHVPRGLQAVVIYPHVEVLTKDARDILSKNVTLSQSGQ